MRNLLKSFVALAAVTLAAAMTLTACKKDNPAPEPPITEVGGQTNQRVWADQTSGTGQVSFETTASWTSSITEVGTTRDTAPGVPATWVTITPSSGAAGNHNITIELDTNYTGSDRTAIITINCGGESIPITVTQKATTQSGEVPVQTVAATGVSVKPVTLALKTGATATLAATVAPENATNKAVTWKSDKPAIATVDAATGEVAGIAPGTAVVTATTADGGHEAICAVTITRPVSGIAVAPAELKLETGDTATLTATVAPDDATDKTFAWSSSAPTIATVDAATGEVKAVAPGTATITATTTDGAQTASCAVTVVAQFVVPTRITSVTWNPDYSVTFTVDGDAAALSPLEYSVTIYRASDNKQVVSGSDSSLSTSGSSATISVARMKHFLYYVPTDGNYYCQVWMGGGSSYANSAPRALTALPQLAKPQNLRWEGGVAKWDTVPNANGYFIILGISPGFTITDTQYDFNSTMTSGLTYSFVVSAHDSNENYRSSEHAISDSYTKP